MKRLRRKRKKKTNKGFEVVKKSITKILAVFLIVGLNWTGLLAIGRTFAYFNDIENSPENIFSAGTLDFILETPGDFSLNFKADEQAVRNINIINQGSLAFQYIIEGADFSGPLCENINLEATLDDGETKYEDSLTSFVLAPAVDFSEPIDNWQFIFSFNGDAETYKNNSCQFYLDFKGWQDNAADYDSSGFKDLERALVRLTLRQEKTIVLNEFLPNPEEDECGREGILGEWVEIYNNSGEPVDLADWYIQDAGAVHTIVIDNSNTLSGSTVIGTKGSGSEWLVVFLNGCILNNDGGDTVSLYNSSGSLADSYSYGGSAPENKSYARYPDGTGPWYDPIPTPGGPNVLESTEPKEETTIIIDGLFVGSSAVDLQTEEETVIEEESITETETEPEEEIVEEKIIKEELEPEPIIEEQPATEVQPADEQPVIEEQPAIEEQPVYAPDNDSDQSDDSGNETEGIGSPADVISE